MTKQENIIDVLQQQAILPLFCHNDAENAFWVIQTLYKTGIRIIEFNGSSEEELNTFIELKKRCTGEFADLYLGIGQIRNAVTASKALDAGADFLVSPVFDAGVCDVAYLNKTLWIPGCMTVTEIHEAEKSGCTCIKIFPGNVLGTDFLHAIRDVFPHIRFIPSGGVQPNLENLSSWFEAGAFAVAIGSKLISNHILETKDKDLLENNTLAILRLVEKIYS